MKLDFNGQLRRTINIVRQMAGGYHLTLPAGYKIAMAEDMTIGYLHGCDEVGYHVSSMATLSLKELNDILNKNDITHFIPDLWIETRDDGHIEDFEIIDNKDNKNKDE